MSLLLRAFALVVCPCFPAIALAQCDLVAQELAPPDGEHGDAFGYRVERSDDVAAVAAPFDADLGTRSGSVYVYEREGPGTEWHFARKLLASDGAEGDVFGYSVGVAGTTIVVGATDHDHPASNGGAAYVFERNAGGPANWGEVAHFTPEGTGADARFGYALAVRGERLLVGAPYQGQSLAGVAYLYRRDGASATGWTLEDEFTSSDPATAFEYGHDVALDDGVMAVSGSRTSILPFSPTYVAHVRELGSDGQWSEVARIESPNAAFGTSDLFAYELTLDGGRLVAVAPSEYDLDSGDIGALYLYERAASGLWALARRLPPPLLAFFAEEADLRGDWLVAGNPGVSTLHVFHRNAGGRDAWGEVTRLVDDDVGADLGEDLVLAGDEVLVGNSYPAGEEPGEVFVIDLARLARATWRNVAASANLDALRAGNRPLLGTTFRADAEMPSGYSLALLAVFADPAKRVLPSGAVLLGMHRLGSTLADGEGRFEIAVPADSTLCGLSATVQAGVFGAGVPLALTNALDLVLGAE
jgi:hypothetical protein